jgi:hypothetical protein
MDDVVDTLLDAITPGIRADASVIYDGVLTKTTVTNNTLLALSLLLSTQTIIAALDLVETRAGRH